LSDRPYNVLFLCTGNSARSILAEALLNKVGRGRFRAFSAGSFPVGRVNPYAEQELRVMGADPASFRSKSWNEFAGPEATPMDFVITVCDQAAGEVCPAWPGQPISAHWGFPDPAQVQGDDETKRLAFSRVTHQLQTRINLFVSLSHDKLDHMALEHAVREIGQAKTLA
jgi:protein-tyrosine-phosphatase